MVIKASSAAEIRTLLGHLQSADPVRRAGAAARLGVIGARAVDRLIALYDATADVHTRLAVLQTLEAIQDPRSGALAGRALQHGPELGGAAAGVLRGLLDAEDGRTAAQALDALVAAALDRRLDRTTRVAAWQALQACAEPVRAPVAAALRADPDDIGSLRPGGDPESAAREALWTDALAGRLPVSPAPLHAIVSAYAPQAALGALRRLVDAIRRREAGEADAAGWMGVRGSLHQALAVRGSRVALYDLRETVERSRAPLPPSFLPALQTLGDASCLEDLAAAWAQAPAAEQVWRGQLAAAIRVIARRERVTRRHRVARRLAVRWPGALRAAGLDAEPHISTPSQTRLRPTKPARSARRSP
ncbi:MAG TPA: hypothetical protein VD833_17635 [Vicinamibacterales bacterium]|nr:hypothetical protein [Vicinamibacterales bacterium]